MKHDIHTILINTQGVFRIIDYLCLELLVCLEFYGHKISVQDLSKVSMLGKVCSVG